MYRRDQQGIAMVTVLMVIVVLGLLGTSIVQMQTFEARQTLRQEQGVQAHFLARSGLEVAVQHLGEQASLVKEPGDLNLDPLEGSIPDVGTYNVVFNKLSSDDPSKTAIDIRSTGVIAGWSRVEEQISLTVSLERKAAGVDYATDIDWFVKSGANNVQKLRSSTASSPLQNLVPVVLGAGQKIMTVDTHYLQAPALQFRPEGWLEIGNRHALTIMSSFISFDTIIDLGKGEIVLNVLDPIKTEDGKKYGVVYFGNSVYQNNANSSFKGIAKGKYYLFEDGTTLKGTSLSKGQLKELSSTSDLNLFDFSDTSTSGSLVIGSSNYSGT